MASKGISIGASLCALAVLAGAFGAHGLAGRLDERALDLWETAARYLMYGGLGVLAVGVAARCRQSPGLASAAVLLTLGSLLFSGTVAALALGGPRWLGAVTPLGGVALVAGFLWFAFAARR